MNFKQIFVLHFYKIKILYWYSILYSLDKNSKVYDYDIFGRIKKKTVLLISLDPYAHKLF